LKSHKALINLKIMRLQTNSYGTNRDNKRKSMAFFIISVLIGLAACDPIIPEIEEKQEEAEREHVIGGWGNHESGDSSTENGRDATHADSIRLGIIPPDN
jgi:hypothetical protein